MTRTGFIVVVALSLVSCTLFDRRSEIARATLLDDSGAFDKAAYSAALAVHHGKGTSVASLKQYVEKTNGDCSTKDNGHLWCEIPFRAGLCWAQMIGLDVQVQEDVVESLIVKIGGLGC